MTNYLFIETRDPFESVDPRFVEQTAAALKERGNEVTLFLLQNGVLAARQKARNTSLSRLAQLGVKILADDFSLLERGIHSHELPPHILASNIETLVESLVQKKYKSRTKV